MGSICDSDFCHLKPGKKVALKSYNGSILSPANVNPAGNYWRLVGAKAVVVTTSENYSHALIRFEKESASSGLVFQSGQENCLWVLVSDLKFVCRY